MVYRLHGSSGGFGPLVLLALAATVVENVAVQGADNLLLPVLIVWVLMALKPIGV